MNLSAKYKKVLSLFAAAFIVLYTATLSAAYGSKTSAETVSVRTAALRSAAGGQHKSHPEPQKPHMPEKAAPAEETEIINETEAEKEETAADAKLHTEDDADESTSAESQEAAEDLYTVAECSISLPEVTLYNTATGSISQLTLEQYVTGVLLAEVPYDFCAEALRAQAIACRTYAVYNLVNGKRHENGASLCTSAGHCQAYVDPSTVSAERLAAAKNAANTTSGEIMLYGGEPVLAAFHSSSGKKTKSSAEVWGGSLDYLVSVETNEGSVADMQTVKTQNYTLAELAAKLRNISAFSAISDNDVAGITLQKSPSGKVLSVSAGAACADGTSVVNALELRSCDYDIYVQNGTATVVCHGYGHGVGLSQYGAEEMARRGKNRYEILAHYYTGINFAYLR